jgi:urea carboxylase-associated protein 2
MSQTATAHGAREHARSLAGAHVETMPTIPAQDAVDLPDGVPAGSVVWDETIAAGGYTSKILRRGSTLRLTDTHGDACANLLLYNAERPDERLNVADTVKVQWQAYLGEGSVLLSDMGRAMASIVADTSRRHDAFCAASNRAVNARRFGDGAVHGPFPNARDQFIVALAKAGRSKRDVAPNINFFKGVRVEPDGTLRWDEAPVAPGAYVELQAEMHLLVVVANTAHVLDPRPHYTVTPLRATAWEGEPTGPADPRWRSTPERERAYLNTGDYFARHPQEL